MLKTAYELGHRGTNMLHTHCNQNMRKEEAVRFWAARRELKTSRKPPTLPAHGLPGAAPQVDASPVQSSEPNRMTPCRLLHPPLTQAA